MGGEDDGPQPLRRPPCAALCAHTLTSVRVCLSAPCLFFCVCRHYFQTAAALVDHERTKPHKRRVKLLLSTPKPHAQLDAELAAGMGRPDNGPRLRSGGGVADMLEEEA